MEHGCGVPCVARSTLLMVCLLMVYLARSTLLMLVSALLGGHERMRAVYGHALDHEYRWPSLFCPAVPLGAVGAEGSAARLGSPVKEIDTYLWRRFLSYGDSNLLACHRDAALPRLPATAPGLQTWQKDFREGP